MSLRQGLSLYIFPALFTVLSASDGKTLASPGSTNPADGSSEHGAPALFSWADFDGDGRLDLAAVSAEGRLQFLANVSEGRFEDATERVGLSGIGNAALVLWADYDGDGRLDLFVGAREGASRLFHNEGGTFVDMSAASGLVLEGAVRSARWLDEDGAGRLDLFVVRPEKHLLFRGLEGGFFEATELPALAAAALGPLPDERAGALHTGALSSPSGTPGDEAGSVLRGDVGAARGSAPLRPTGSPGAGPAIGLGFPPVYAGSIGDRCANSIRDQARPESCLEASTLPALGLLYPLSTNLFVAVGGNVGIGTTTPSARLEVAGTVRVTDTLTLAPLGDTALDIATGSIYKGGALFLHTRGGSNNTGLGRQALSSVTAGLGNTASGAGALRFNTSGSRNTASGYDALYSNTTGSRNTASGVSALRFNTTGSYNTAGGTYALLRNTTGSYNTACGARALFNNTVGSRNTASGFGALLFNTTGFSNTASGYRALSSNTTGFGNTANGALALRSNTGSANTASGACALSSNTTGGGNAASGSSALSSNTTGSGNTACGNSALFSSTTGSNNTACGVGALAYNTTGQRNIALGRNAGQYLTTGNDNIVIGNVGFADEGATIRIGTTFTHTSAFIAGIRGVTTGFANAIPVLIDSAGQLGTVSSSRRFKEEIRDMGELTDRLLVLRPVVFRCKPEVQEGERPLEYGLIAEEVAEVFPELVVYDEEGKPFTVKYHLLSSMLLNELKKLSEEHERLESQAGDHERELAGLRSRLAALEGRSTPTRTAAGPVESR